MRKSEQRASTWVLLADVRMSDRRRRGLSVPKVELYRQWLEEGREAPPVELALDGEGFVVRDGRHRVAAALEAGHAGIEAVLPQCLRWLVRVPVRVGRFVVRLAWPAPVWGRSSGGRAPRLHRGGAGSTPAVSTFASVVSAASTRPLYGRGAGSTPAGGLRT